MAPMKRRRQKSEKTPSNAIVTGHLRSSNSSTLIIDICHHCKKSISAVQILTKKRITPKVVKIAFIIISDA